MLQSCFLTIAAPSTTTVESTTAMEAAATLEDSAAAMGYVSALTVEAGLSMEAGPSVPIFAAITTPAVAVHKPTVKQVMGREAIAKRIEKDAIASASVLEVNRRTWNDGRFDA
jgi:hypothetical protein